MFHAIRPSYLHLSLRSSALSGHRSSSYKGLYTSHRSLYTQTLLHTEIFTRHKTNTHRGLTDAFTHRRFYTHTLLHTDVVTHKRFYTQMHLHTEAYSHRSFYTQTLLHREALTYRRFDTQTLLHADAFTHRLLYTRTLLHREALTYRRFDTQTLLHADAFTHRLLYTRTLLHRRFYAQTLLHTDAFTHRCFYTQTLFTQHFNTQTPFTHTHTFAQNCLIDLSCGMHRSCKKHRFYPDQNGWKLGYGQTRRSKKVQINKSVVIRSRQSQIAPTVQIWKIQACWGVTIAIASESCKIWNKESTCRFLA